MSAIVDFEQFMKAARWAQPLHRGALATDGVAPVTSECDPKALVLPPQLAKERQLEIMRGATPAPTIMPGLNKGGGHQGFGSMQNLNLNNVTPNPPSEGGRE